MDSWKPELIMTLHIFGPLKTCSFMIVETFFIFLVEILHIVFLVPIGFEEVVRGPFNVELGFS